MISISVNVHLKTDCRISVSQVSGTSLIKFETDGEYPSVTIFAYEGGASDLANALRAAADAVLGGDEDVAIPLCKQMKRGTIE